MAIYHLSVNTISRGKGQSAIASAAYRSGEKLHSERYGKDNFYPREVQPETFILKPEHAPEWTLDREKLWNGVEEVEKNSKAQLAREINIALPVELNHEEQRQLAEEYVQKNFVDEGMVADVAIHRDDLKNPHFHVMLTMRPFLENGEWGNKQEKVYVFDNNGNKMKTEKGNIKSKTIKTTDWDSKERLSLWRKNWADLTNKYLEKKGLSERISEKSHAELGIKREPTIHEGYVARQMEKEGKISNRCETNREIKKRNFEKEKERKYFAEKETQKNISSGLTPKEKQQLKHVARNLKVFVNYDNLIDKQRMINNWERSTILKMKTEPNTNVEKTLEKIKESKENLSIGKEILEKQFTRIYEKNYPELNEKYNYSTYYKMVIADETLKQDRVLSEKEIGELLVAAQENELNYMLKTIVENPYIQPVHEYQRKLFNVTEKLNLFLDEKGITKEQIYKLNEEDLKEYRKLYNTQNIHVKTLEVLDRYFENNIKTYFNNADLKDMNIKQKEALSHVIDYYGNKMSFDKLANLANEESVNKYSAIEQKIGLSYIYKLETNSFTSEELKEIEENYSLQEIYKTVSDPKLREYFLNEVQNNGYTIPSEFQQNSSNFSLGFLANNLNMVDNLLNANKENQRRELEDKRKKNSIKRNSKEQSKEYKKSKNITRL